jgi:inosine-uridine nucleoside N-ribohydrolase
MRLYPNENSQDLLVPMPINCNLPQIIIDTDPGQDDAIAILFALGASHSIQVRALTTVAGNVPVQLASRNARVIRDWGNRSDLPVYGGCERPLLRELVNAFEVHGENGLAGVELDEPKAPLESVHAVHYLVDTLRQAEEAQISLVAIGPLTNIATALILAPEIKRGIKEIVIMGGAYLRRGNVSPCAEFNFYVDPHAADIVFRSGVPLVVLPLDVTHEAISTPPRIAKLRELGNRTGRIVADILTSYQRHDMEKFGADGGPLHDPCTIGYLLEPGLFKGRELNVSIELHSDLTIGESVVDWNFKTSRSPNALWIHRIAAEPFYDLLTSCISELP